ncbi:MAG: S8 family peptidase [Gammaproteobacteria bacterium]|nr:S8 family peptidase [Gammaproteobacteria bacterium]
MPAWPQDVDVSLKWRSETRTADQLAQAMERLYVVLYNTDSLPTRPWLDRRGVTVEQALRDNGLFHGAFFPGGVDAVMCDLNPDVCTRERVGADEAALARVDAHVGGFRVSSGRWSNKAGDRLNLPASDFSAYTTLQQIEVAGAAELKRMIDESGADCSQYGLSCGELVKRLNPQLGEDASSAGKAPIKVTVPVSGVETTLRFSADAAAEAATLSRVPEQLKAVKAPAPEPSDAVRQAPVYDARWSERLKATPPASSGIEALSPNIMSSGSVRLESSHEPGVSNDADDGGTSVEADFTRLLESIHYPFGDATAIPEPFRVEVPVGVFDTFADTGHCDLGDNVEPVEVIGGGSERDPAEHCGDLLPAPNVIDDHGTHVVGLLAATGSNGIGMWGLNPFARVLYVQVDKNQLRVPDYRGHLSSQMVQMYLGSRMKVANLSWRYTNSVGSVDTIADTIRALQQNFLVVVAAGNDNVDFSGGNCGELPACLTGYDNVITVVGLSRDGEGLWASGEHGTNTSSEFHIAAIAEDVVSTVYGGYTGRMSGTSQAAPRCRRRRR